ncbi:hypothetical protein VE01_02018 [Pseudogymnoascus verrucosus]|uniref:Uncharacterized protein n=1 Tax=Pseudogymnoascus verrucosus TaxID=342668 RepID=A0A1B8GVQ9_9PEZI|nr:uncharacterized protein VE01_02018 [Pseudogymnoascus verrucosus]OBT99914.1 hypothetical protein VE01_02018 [Pseudogymnoascus verrucosus]
MLSMHLNGGTGQKGVEEAQLAAVFLIITMMWRRRHTSRVYGRSLPYCVRGACADLARSR